MQRLEVSGVVRPIYKSLGVKRLRIYGFINIFPFGFMQCTGINLILFSLFRTILKTIKKSAVKNLCHASSRVSMM